MASEVKNVEIELDEKTQKRLELEDTSCGKKIEFLPTNSFSKLLEGVVLAAAANSNSTVAFQGQLGMSHQEALGTVTAITDQAIQQRKTQDEPSSSIHSSAEEKVVKLNPDTNNNDAPTTPKSDMFNWRKYGQKHVKSSGSSRSYFRCTNSSCCAKKKVQHFDESGKIIEVVYKGNHNHDPPPCIVKSFNRKRSFNESSVEKRVDLCKEEPKRVLQLTYECVDNHDKELIKIPDATRQESESEQSILAVEEEHGRSSNTNELALTDNTMNERDIPIKKRRVKEVAKESSQCVYRTFKEPKVVVHTDENAGISCDGYRWRKYGQKMVKGNIHPRSYYRCSSIGCPVRKHVEKATDGSTAIISMYEGEHDHNKPLPKKQHTSFKPTDTVKTTLLLKSAEEKSTSPTRESSGQPCEVPRTDQGKHTTVSESETPKVLEMNVGIKL